MSNAGLNGLKVLVVEDEYLLADDMRGALDRAGAQVLGPVPTVDQAALLLECEPTIDVALLDVNLRGKMVFEIADRMRERAIPFAFVTGYDASTLPSRFADIRTLTKPVRLDDVVQLVAPVPAGQAI